MGVTTKITVEAAGHDVKVHKFSPETAPADESAVHIGSEYVSSEMVRAGETREFFLHSGVSLKFTECEPAKEPIPDEPSAAPIAEGEKGAESADSGYDAA